MGGSFSAGDIHNEYVMKEKLGMGSFATVKRCVRKSDKSQFAVKQIKKVNLTKEELDSCFLEVDIMKKIDHPNCVRLFDMYQSKKKIYIVLELLTGGELFDRIVQKGNYSEAEAASLTKTLLETLKYLHSINIVHRDLKPENLLYSTPSLNSEIKITDFGLAKTKDDGKNNLHTACGTPGYVAPEVLIGAHYGAAVDIWSVGVILYILLCGFPPFYDESTRELYKQIRKGKFSFPAPYWTEISDSAKDVVKKCLTVDPEKRATPDELLAHPWISGGEASDKKFGGNYTKRLKLMQSRLHLRKGVKAIIAMNRFKRALEARASVILATANEK